MQCRSFLESLVKISITVSVASIPPTVAVENATPSIILSFLITTPAKKDFFALLVKLSAMPSTRIPDFAVCMKGLMNVDFNIM